MLKLLWYILVAFAISMGVSWLLDNDGQVVITWLQFEVRTGIVAITLMTVFFALVVFMVSYLLAKILAFKFPKLSQLFFKKSRLKKLENLVSKGKDISRTTTQLLMAIETNDAKSSNKLQNKLSKLIKNSQLNHFLAGKIAFDDKNYVKSEELFSKLEESDYAKILILKSKFQLALEKEDEGKAISYAEQILLIRKGDSEVIHELCHLYKKRGLWQKAKDLVSQYGVKNLTDEMQRRDIAVMNTAIAADYYRQRKFSKAVEYAKIALKSEKDFLPATEILLRSWIKRGFVTKAGRTIKKMWQKNPHLILAEIYDLIYRKSSAKSRIKAMKKLAKINEENYLGDLAIGIVAFRLGNYDLAKEFLRLSLLKKKTSRAYNLLSYVEGVFGDKGRSKRYNEKAKMITHDDHYMCGDCGHSSSKWSAKCVDCGSGSLDWCH